MGCARRVSRGRIIAVLFSSSETQGLLAGTMRYFRQTLTLRAEQPLGTYSFRTSSRSGRIPSADWVEKYISVQSAMRASRVALSPFYTKQFSSSIDQVAWPGKFQEKIFNEAKEIAILDMGAKKHYSSINFLGEFFEGTSIVNFCGRFLHCCFWLWESQSSTYIHIHTLYLHSNYQSSSIELISSRKKNT